MARLASLLSALPGTGAFAVRDPEEYVNVMMGSVGNEDAQRHHSTGNTLAFVARPWGFNHWAPQTTANFDTSWWFDVESPEFHGVRLTHQASPWIGDYGWMVIRPWLGGNGNEFMGYTSYRARGAMRPSGINVTSGPEGVRTELTPTDHGAVLRVAFPEWVPAEKRMVCFWVPEHEKGEDNDMGKKLHFETGECAETSDGGLEVDSRRFAAGVPKEKIWGFHANVRPLVRGVFTKRSSRECCLTLQENLNIFEARIGTSFISAEQAVRNADMELGNRSFELVLQESKRVWSHLLGRLEIQDAGSERADTFKRISIFYSCLYKALLFPRKLGELTPEGLRHWSPYDGNVRPGQGVTDNGFWDTFRTVYQLLALVYPQELGELVQGWVNAYSAGGWLPQWASPGYRGSMTGTFADVVIADALLKGIEGIDHEEAWAALKQDAYTKVPDPRDTTRGKQGLQQYVDNGYISKGSIEEACSRTLDIAYADVAAAAVAQKLGHEQDAVDLRKRATRATVLMFDPKVKLMGRRKPSRAQWSVDATSLEVSSSDGAKNQDQFDSTVPEEWGSCYTEGSAWTHSFPGYDLDLLARLHGGRDALLQRLKDMVFAPSRYRPGSYYGEIHEIREMHQVAMGQYGHNNQPVHHVLYMFAELGDRNLTARLVRHVMDRTYSTEGFIGDEDNGEMGAWYVLSALGLFASAVGTNSNYTMGAVPLFPQIRLKALNVTIQAAEAEADAPVPGRITWRRGARVTRLEGASVDYLELRQGGTLRFGAPGETVLGRAVSGLRGAVHDAVQPVTAPAASPIPLVLLAVCATLGFFARSICSCLLGTKQMEKYND